MKDLSNAEDTQGVDLASLLVGLVVVVSRLDIVQVTRYRQFHKYILVALTHLPQERSFTGTNEPSESFRKACGTSPTYQSQILGQLLPTSASPMHRQRPGA